MDTPQTQASPAWWYWWFPVFVAVGLASLIFNNYVILVKVKVIAYAPIWLGFAASVVILLFFITACLPAWLGQQRFRWQRALILLVLLFNGVLAVWRGVDLFLH
jgi:hypothetical protein